MQSCGKSLLLFHKLKSRHPEAKSRDPLRKLKGKFYGIPRREHGTQAYGVCAQRTFCPLFLIQRKRASLPPIQRSATPLGAQSASLCSNSAAVTILSFRIDRKMFVFEVLGDLRRMFGLDLLACNR